jgi:glutathione S-transferase
MQPSRAINDADLRTTCREDARASWLPSPTASASRRDSSDHWLRVALERCRFEGTALSSASAMANPAKLVVCDFPAKTNLDGWSSFSPFVLEVDRALGLAKLPFERHHVNMMKLKELNPLGQLPVLLVGDEKVPDSTRILQRIEAMAPGSMTGGLDARTLAEAWLWEEFADTALYPYVLATRWADDRSWPLVKEAFFKTIPKPIRFLIAPMIRKKTVNKLVERDFTRDGLDACYARLRRVLDELDARAPEEGFWLGPRASVADLGLFAHLHSLRIPLTPFQAAEVAKRARLSRWLDRVDKATRPGVSATPQPS